MSSFLAISAEKLSRLIGTPNAPALIDVRTEEDFAADPRLHSGRVAPAAQILPDWAARYRGRKPSSSAKGA